MPSTALGDWRGARATRLDQLVTAHGHLSGSKSPGRRFTTQSTNWSLTLLLASEFQGFVKDLHAEASDVLAAYIANGDVAILTLVRANLVAGREVDFANAKRDSIRKDLVRLGVPPTLWADLEKRTVSGLAWKRSLDRLNEARNGAAHNDLKTLSRLKADHNITINLAQFKKWRTACNGIAKFLDDEVGKAVKGMIGSKPW